MERPRRHNNRLIRTTTQAFTRPCAVTSSCFERRLGETTGSLSGKQARMARGPPQAIIAAKDRCAGEVPEGRALGGPISSRASTDCVRREGPGSRYHVNKNHIRPSFGSTSLDGTKPGGFASAVQFPCGNCFSTNNFTPCQVRSCMKLSDQSDGRQVPTAVCGLHPGSDGRK
jgi:hypothetical protein